MKKAVKNFLTVALGFAMSLSSIPDVSMPSNINAQAASAKSGIKSCKISLSSGTLVYTGKGRYPAVTVKKGSKKLTKNRDYTIKYKNNVKVGKAKVIVTGKGKYKGSVTKSYNIIAVATPAAPKVSGSSSQVKLSWGKVSYTKGYILQRAAANSNKYKTIYQGKKLAYTDKKITKGSTYKYRVGSYRKIGRTTYYRYSSPKTVKAVTTTSIAKCKISLSENTRVYNGNAQQPYVTVKYGSSKLTQGKSYKIFYSNQVNVGTANVKVVGIGNFNGECDKKYSIKAFNEAVSAPTLKCTSSSITLNWDKVNYAESYYVERLDPQTNKFERIVTTSNLTHTDHNLKENTSYTYKLTAYRHINGKEYCISSPIVTKKTVLVNVYNKQIADETLKLVNKKRANNGKSALTFDAELNNAALDRAKFLANKGCTFVGTNDHYLTDSEMKKFGYELINGEKKMAAFYMLDERNFDFFNNKNFYNFGENLAMGQTSPNEVVNSWWDSDGHRKNMLNGAYTRTGIACYIANGTYYWVQLFAS